MKYVKRKEECSGCRACEQICPVKCISVVSDEEGFQYPVINDDKCISCKKCIEVCEREFQEDDKIFLEEKLSYAVKNINKDIRKKSSSGGVFYELAREAIKRKGNVYGAAFDENYHVHQIGISSTEHIQKLMGSKYVQSDTKFSYEEVKKLVESGIFVLYSGTPCQIKGLKQYLNKDFKNLLCVSLICHGVPSGMVWERYVKLKKGEYADENLREVSFRDKSDGWRNMNLKMTFSEHTYSSIHNRDIYFQGFNQNLFLRPACYQCRAKEKLGYADIIIGDFWGIEHFNSELDDGQGVSCVIINSIRGLSFWKIIEDHFIVQKCKIEDIVKRNPCLYGSVDKNPRRKKFFSELNITGLVEGSIRNNLIDTRISKETRQQYQYEIIRKYLKKTIKKDSIFKLLIQQGVYHICVYTVTDLSELVVCDLLHLKECKLMYICDRNYKAYQDGIWGVKVVNLQKLIDDVSNDIVDLIIICNPLREDEIFEELIMKGIPQNRIISIKSLIND